MASNNPYEGYAPNEPDQQAVVAPAATVRGSDPYSGYDVLPGLAAKATAVGTDTPPDEAGSNYSQSVKTNTPPEVIKADPVAFKKEQQDKEAAAAIDNDPDLAHFVNTVPDAAAISSGDWHTLGNIAKHAAEAAPDLLDNFIYDYITTPSLDYAKAGIESIKQSWREGSDVDGTLYDKFLALPHLAAGVIDIAMASSGGAAAMEGYLNVMQKLGVSREDAGLALLALGHRLPGRSVAPIEKPVITERPTGRDNLEQVAAYYKEFEPSEIKKWSNEDLKTYVNQKLGMGSAAQDYAKTQTPSPGMDKALDEFNVEQSNMDKDTIGRLLQAVQESKTKERSPEAMEALLNLKGLGDKDVWLPSDLISEAYDGTTPHPDDKQWGWVDNIAQRLPEATELGAEISLPLSKFLANVDPAVYSQFKDFIRFGESGLNPIEADQWIENYHEKYEDDALKENEDQLEVAPDDRVPDRRGPKEFGVENFLPLREDYKSKPGVNVSRTLKLLGTKIYGEPTQLDKVTVKELLQNAYDAVKGSLEKGGPQGNINLEFDHQNRVIKLTDNGHGMTPEVLGTKFLEVAGTDKETTQASGGLGIAKMLFLLENRGLNVITMRNGKVSELNTHGEELHAAFADPQYAPKIKVRAPTAADRKLFPDGQGTHVEVTIPETYKDSQTGEEKHIGFETLHEYHPVLNKSPLFGNLTLTAHEGFRQPKVLPVGNAFPINNFTQFPPAKFAWGTAQIYVSKQPISKDEVWRENVHFLSNGIWQFSQNLKVNPMDWASDNIPYTFYVDVHPSVKPEDSGYPFDLNRQQFTKAAKDSFTQVLNYLAKTYSQLDFASQASSYGDIQYLTPGKGKIDVSPRTKLEPKVPPSKTTMTGLKDTDKIEFKGDRLYVNGKQMPSLTNEDLGKATIKFDELMVDQKLIDPNKVMLHSSMETKVDAEAPPMESKFEKWAKQIDQVLVGAGLDPLEKPYTLASTLQHLEDLLDSADLQDKLRDKLLRYHGTLENLGPRAERQYQATLTSLEDALLGAVEAAKKEPEWRPLDEVAREKFGPAFDNFMYEVGDVFLRLRDNIAKLVPGYKGVMDEAIGISFDSEYRGVSIRVPFSGSFINPALPFDDDPLLAATGTWGTMVHELAHHRVRSHGVEFEAEMQKLHAYLDREKIKILNEIIHSDYNPQGAINALAKTFTTYNKIFTWLNKTIQDESRTRTRGRRIKGAGQERGAGAAGGPAEGAQPAAGPVPAAGGGQRSTEEISGPTPTGKGFSINPTEQLAQVLLHAEKKSLYLAPLFRDAKSAGMTQKLWTAYAKKLQKMDEEDYEKALAAAQKEVVRTLTPEYQDQYNTTRNEVESDLLSSKDLVANRLFRFGLLPTGESREPPKLDRTAVEYMGGKGAIRDLTAEGGVHPDDAATGLGYQSGRELVQALSDFDRGRGNKTAESYLDQLIEDETLKRMADKYGDPRERIAQRAQEIALENHHVDILIAELKHLAATSGQLPFTLEQISRRVDELFDRVPFKEAKYHTYQKAVFKAGVAAEEHLLAGKIDKAFKAKETQIFAVLAAKKARTFEAYRKSQENTFKRLANNGTLSGIEQRYVDFAHDILTGMGYGHVWNHPNNGSYADFVTEHAGDIASAYWITDPTQIRKMPNGAAIGYKDMTVEEFTALAKTIQSILHVGRDEKKINTIYGKAYVENALGDMVASMKRWPDKLQPIGIFGIRGGTKGAVRYVNAAHMLVERMLDYADKFDPRGPFSRYIDRPMREGYNEEIKLGEAVVKKLKYIREKYVDSSIYDVIDNREILDPLNGNQPMQLTRWNLRKIIAHGGSESGLEKIVKGHKVTEDQVYALIVRNATKQDIEFANLMWELHNDLWQRAAIKYEKRTGVTPDPIKARPFDIQLKSGETVHATGGHEQVIYDRDLSSIAQDLAIKGDPFEDGYVDALPPNKYQVPRTQYFGPLDFSGSMESSRIAGMIHDIAFRDAVLDIRKLLQSKEATKAGGLRDTIKKKFGVQYDRLLDGWLKDIANAHAVEDDFLRGGARALSIIRQNVTNALIFLKPTVAFKHGLTALGMSTTQVGAKGMASGLYDVGAAGMVGAVKDMAKEHGMGSDPAFAAAFHTITRPGKRGMAARQFIYNSSPMMRARRRQYRNSIRGAVDALGSAGWRRTLVDARQVSMSIGRIGVAMADSLSADAEWLSKYNQHFRETGDHDEAVYQGDRAVTRAHGSSFVGDRSAILRSRNEWIRNTALLFTYWNHFTVNMIQLGWDIGARFQGRDEPGATAASIASRIALLFVLATLTDMAAEAIFTHDKRPLWLQGLRALGRQIGTGYYGLREVTNLALGYEPASGAIGLMFKSFAQIVKDAASGHPSHDWLRHMTGAMGMLTGIGGDQIGATATGVANAITGEETPEGIGEVVKQLATGRPRPAR